MTAFRGRSPEPGVRRPVVLADVRLDLDDPPDAAAAVVLADEAQADQRRRDLERRPAEELPEGRSAGSAGST